VKPPSPSRNGVNHADAPAARDPPPLTTQLAFARRELAMARVEAQPNWWLADQPQTPEQWAYRLACLEAICATLARCCEDAPQSHHGTPPAARPQDTPGPPRSRRRRTPPTAWQARPKAQGEHEPLDEAGQAP
jgi:hypothetical protein